MSATTTISSEPYCQAAEWTVYYHQPGKLKGRGEFLRLMLEDAGIKYAHADNSMLYGPTALMDMFRGSVDAIDEDLGNWPCLYPPAIFHQPVNGDPPVVINQVGACMIYVGDQLGYNPASAAERARANSVLLNALDCIDQGRRSFHPVKDNASYSVQKQEGDKASKEWTVERLPKFLKHFNKIAARNAAKAGKDAAPIAGGDAITYADFALWHVLDAVVHQFDNDKYDKCWERADVKALKQYYDWMKQRPNLQAYFASDRCAPFAGDSMM